MRTYNQTYIWSGSGNICTGGRLGAGTSTPSYKLDSHGKSRIYEASGSTPSTTEVTLILRHGNGGGTSSIVFPSAVNRGSDYGYISYSDSNYGGGERARLRIGTLTMILFFNHLEMWVSTTIIQKRSSE